MGLVAVALVIRSDLVTRLAGNAIQVVAERALGEEVTIGAVTVGYFPPEVGLQGVVISHRADGERIVGVHSVRARFGVKDWKPGLVELVVERPDVRLHLDADGLREFRDAVSSGSAPPKRFPWLGLTVLDGHFRLDGGDFFADVAGIDIQTEADGRLDVAWAAVELSRGSVHERAGPTRFKHVTLAPDRLAIPNAAITFDHLAIEGSFSAEVGGPLAGDLSLLVGLPAFTTSAVEPRSFVDGTVNLDISLGGESNAPVIDARLATENVVAWRVDSSSVPHALNLGAIVGPLHFEDGRLTAERLSVRWGDGEVNVKAEVDVEALTVEAAVLAEGIHLGRVLRQAGAFADPWIDFPGDVETHVTGTLSPLSLSGPFKVVFADLVVREGRYDGTAAVMLDVPRGRVQGTLALDAHHIVLDAYDTRFGPGYGRTWADIGFAESGPLALRTDIHDLDLGWLQPLAGAGLGGRAHVTGRLEGPFHALRASADLDVIDAEVLEFGIADRLRAHLASDLQRLEFTGLSAELGRTRYAGNYTLLLGGEELWMDAQLAIPEGRLRDLSGIFVDLGELDGDVVGNAVLRGEPRRLTGEVHIELTGVNVYGETGFDGGATAWMDDGILTIDDLSLRRGGAGLLARGTVGRGYAMNLELLTDGFTLEGLDHLATSPVALAGGLVADVQVGGTLFAWAPRGQVRTGDVRVSGRAVAPSEVQFRTDAEGRLVWEGDLLGGAGTVGGRLSLKGEQPYDLHAEFAEFPVDVFYPIGADGTRVEATLSG
jgi:hypothetical protein